MGRILRELRIGLVAVLVIGLLVAWAPPVLGGYHLTDGRHAGEACESRLGLEWCKPIPARQQATEQAEREASEHPGRDAGAEPVTTSE